MEGTGHRAASPTQPREPNRRRCPGLASCLASPWAPSAPHSSMQERRRAAPNPWPPACQKEQAAVGPVRPSVPPTMSSSSSSSSRPPPAPGPPRGTAPAGAEGPASSTSDQEDELLATRSARPGRRHRAAPASSPTLSTWWPYRRTGAAIAARHPALQYGSRSVCAAMTQGSQTSLVLFINKYFYWWGSI